MSYKYITGFMNEDFFKEVREGIADAAAQLHVQADFVGTETDDCDVLNRMIYDAIREKCEGIAVNFMHPTKLNQALEACRDAGIPVVSFNMDGEAGLRLATVSQHFYEAGLRLGERMKEAVDEGSTVLFTQHDPGIHALEERERGIRKALENKNIRALQMISGNTPHLARMRILQMLEDHPDIRWIFCTGQSDTHGAGLAAEEMAPGTIRVAGFDVCGEILDMIRRGTIEATVDQQPYVQGFYPLLLLYQYRTRGITPFDIETGNAIISRRTAEKILQGEA